MQKNFVRVLAAVLVLVLVLGFIAMAANAQEDGYASLAEALANNASFYQLTDDAADVTINSDITLDLNGHHVTNATVAEGVTLQLVDSANDQYDLTECGSFAGTINGTVAQITENNTKSYLVLEDNGVYSAHRYYVGITHVSLDPAVTGFGYKAQFYGDSAVQGQVLEIGYDLWLEGRAVVTRTTEFKNLVTLRLKNFLVEEYGEEPVNARAFMILKNGDKLEGAVHAYSMRSMVELINETYTSFTATQLKSAAEMILANPVMLDWEVENILRSRVPEATVETSQVKNEEIGLYEGYVNPKPVGSAVMSFDAYTFVPQDTLEQAKNGAYSNWIADYYVSMDREVQSGLYLVGNYGSFGWVAFEAPAGQTYTNVGLMTTFGANWTYADIVAGVDAFKCGVMDMNGNHTGATFTVQLRLVNPADANDYIVVTEIQTVLGNDIPQATVESIIVENQQMQLEDTNQTVTLTLEGAHSFSVQDTMETISANAYQYWNADYYISIDQEVQEGLYLAGNYGEYGWIALRVPAGQTYTEFPVVSTLVGEQMRYRDLVKLVGTFSCGVADSLGNNGGATITVELRLTNPNNPDNYYTISNIVEVLDIQPPKANVESVIVENETMQVGTSGQTVELTLEGANRFSLVDGLDSIQGETYKNWIADYYISIDQNVQEGLYLAGNYGEYGWIALPVAAGETYTAVPVLQSLMGQEVLYKDLVKFVDIFTCGVADTLGNNGGATVTVELRLTNPNNAQEYFVISNIVEVLDIQPPKTSVEQTVVENQQMQISGTDEVVPLTLEAATEISLKDGLDTVQGETYKTWIVDLYISADQTLEEGLYLAGNYGDSEWLAVSVPVSMPVRRTAQNFTSVPLLNALMDKTVTYADLVELTGSLICGVADTLGKNVGATVTIQLRLTDPEDAGNFVVVAQVEQTIEKASPKAPAVETQNAVYGQTLAAIALPEGFRWEDATLSVGNAGKKTFTAIYSLGENSHEVSVEVTVIVAKAEPIVPTHATLTAKEDTVLSDITLADGFVWANGAETVKLGENTYDATFIPADETNYNRVSVKITIVGEEKEIKDKFLQKMPEASFTYRLGNGNAVALGSLFKQAEGAVIKGDVQVEVTGLASCVYKANTSDWTKGTLQFTGVGDVAVTIYDESSNELTLNFQIVDANNATTAASATANNVVLLNDAGFSSLTVSGGYTLFGNGFTLTCGSDVAAKDLGYSFVTLENGILDNVQIVCPNFDYAALYKSEIIYSRSQTDNDVTRYYNTRSAIIVTGNSQILNSRVSGGRAAVYVTSGDLLIDNSRIELGAVANILVGSSTSKLVLRDVTLVQKPAASTYDSSKKLMGFSVLYLCNADGNAAPTTLEGELRQWAWINESHKSYVPSSGQSLISSVLSKTEFLHDLDGDGTQESVNLGFAYIPEDQDSVSQPSNITDNRTDKATVPYEATKISALMKTFYVVSYKNSQGTADDMIAETEYVSNQYSDVLTVDYTGAEKSLENGTWVYELNVDMDQVSTVDFSQLSMKVNGNAVSYTVNGAAKPTSPVAVKAGKTDYTLAATVNGKTNTVIFRVIGTESAKESPSLVAFNQEAGLCVASSYGGTWSGAAPALQGVQIKYWSVAEKQYKTINLSDYTPTTKGKQNGTNNTWTYSPANGDFTLTLTGGLVHSSNKIYAMPVVCDGKLYFLASAANGLVNSGNSARAVPVSYTFKDNNGGDVLTFSESWSVAENKDAQYKYSDFCNGTLTKLEGSSSGGNCVSADTLVTLADGTQVRVDSLTGSEQLLVWNMETGKLDAAPIMFVDSDPTAEYEIVHLYFSDGTDVKVIAEHGFWDYDLNRYVYLDQNAAAYIGHTFAKQNGDVLAKVQLVNVIIETEVTEAWSPVTCGHLCYFVNGMLSMPGGVGGLFNIFDVNPETMTYDYEAMARDVETYGLFTYEEMNSIVELPEEMFEAAGGAYLKISIGKGNLTEQELIDMIVRYTKFF